MKNSNSSNHLIAAVVTIALCVAVFGLWLPSVIEHKSSQVFIEETPAITPSQTAVSKELLDYIQETRKVAEEQAETLNEEELAQAIEKMQQNLANQAGQILANRFKHPELEEFNSSEAFTISEDLQDVVQFWVHIFGKYTHDHYVFYNKDYVGVVYSVLDFSEIDDLSHSEKKAFKYKMMKDEKKRLKNLLAKVSKHIQTNKNNLKGLNAEETRIAQILLKNKSHLDLSERSLQQSFAWRKGFSHRVEKAIKTSGLYMPEMQRIFTERGLPKELTMIPFIESSFNLKAYSHAGAAGIWQFITATGKRYLRIDEFVDERYDPILAAYAAATHLANEYKFLKSWPMTVNAYNTGPGRMLQAKKRLGTTDISEIIKKFNGAGYGFDSRNYYPEFLAMLHIYENQETYFGEIEKLPAMTHEYVALPTSMTLKDIAVRSGLSEDVLAQMNLALKPQVVDSQKPLPKGYLLKVPEASKNDVLLAMNDIYNEFKFATHHVVEKGDSLKKIARKYDLPIKELAMINQVLPKQKLTAGSIIRLPSQDDAFEYTQLNEDGDPLVRPDDVGEINFQTN